MYLINNEQQTQIKAVFTMFKSSDFIIIFRNGVVIGYNNELSILKTTNVTPQLFGDIDKVFITKSTASTRDIGDFILTDDGIILHQNQLNMNCIELKHLKRCAIASFNNMQDILFDNAYCSNYIDPYIFEDLQCDETFQSQVMSIKASSGGIEYKGIENFIMTLYTGILPITKSDKVSLKIYNGLYMNAFLCHYIIKKKTGIMNVFIKYLKV